MFSIRKIFWTCLAASTLSILFLFQQTAVVQIFSSKSLPSATAPKIGIVVVIKGNSATEYSLAMETMECYAAHWNISYHRINSKVNERCRQRDFFFRRHCEVAHLLDNSMLDWVLILDADTGVINPKQDLKRYIPSDASIHVVFYDRIMNQELMAGSFMVRNSATGRRFLHQFANNFYYLPKSFHGTDNGAVHMFVLSFALAEKHSEWERCEPHFWNSTSWDTVYIYEACARVIMKRFPPPGIEIRNKTHALRWSRDAWLSNFSWSTNDFMSHAWKEKYFELRKRRPLSLTPIQMLNKIVPNRNNTADHLLQFCKSPDYVRLWDYADGYETSPDEIARAVQFWILKADDLFAKQKKLLGMA